MIRVKYGLVEFEFSSVSRLPVFLVKKIRSIKPSPLLDDGYFCQVNHFQHHDTLMDVIHEIQAVHFKLVFTVMLA